MGLGEEMNTSTEDIGEDSRYFLLPKGMVDSIPLIEVLVVI